MQFIALYNLTTWSTKMFSACCPASDKRAQHIDYLSVILFCHGYVSSMYLTCLCPKQSICYVHTSRSAAGNSWSQNSHLASRNTHSFWICSAKRPLKTTAVHPLDLCIHSSSWKGHPSRWTSKSFSFDSFLQPLPLLGQNTIAFSSCFLG